MANPNNRGGTEEKKLIDQAVCVSFDIFDTLLCRQVEKPEDVFEIVERMIAHNGSAKIPFRGMRIQAEKDARRAKGRGEVTLEEIYGYIKAGQEAKTAWMNLEIRAEHLVSRPDPKGSALFRACLERGKRVVLTSDMYLGRRVIESLLQKAGITGYENLYLSSERNARKLTGELFRILVKEENLRPQEILHIGDNLVSDKTVPERMGIQAILFSGRDEPRSLFQKKMYPSAIVSGFSPKHGFKNIGEQIGWQVLGPLLYGFSAWLWDAVEKKNPDKILFLSRDGAIMMRAYGAYTGGKTENCAYAYASRRALIVPTLWKNCSIDHIRRVIHFYDGISVKGIFEKLGIDAEDCKEALKEAGLSEASRMDVRDFAENEQLRKLFVLSADVLKAKSKVEYVAARKYLKGMVGEAKTVFLVDIGWYGNMQNAIETLLEDEIRQGLKVSGFYLGIHPDTPYSHAMAGYLWDKTQGQEWKERFWFVTLLEILFAAEHGSVSNYKEEPPFALLRENEYKNQEGRKIDEWREIKIIQDAAVSFVSDFQGYFPAFRIPYTIQDAAGSLFDLGLRPSFASAEYLGRFRHMDVDVKYLAYSERGSFSPVEFRASLWKIAYLKRTLHVSLPYDRIYGLLMTLRRRMRKSRELR